MIEFGNRPWPPTDEDRERLLRYKQGEQLFRGQHAAAFERLSARVPENRRRIIYVSVNLARLITNTCADFLLGEAPGLRLGEPGSTQQALLDAMIEANGLLVTLYEGERATSFRGDAVYRARIGPRQPGGDDELLVDELPAHNYFAERDPDNARSVLSEAIAWVRPGPKDGQQALRVEHHFPGHIVQQAFLFDSEAQKVGHQINLAALYGKDAPPEEEETGVGSSLLVHVPNERDGSIYYGEGDYTGLLPLFDELNGRLSKIARILDRHAAPKLMLPPGTMDASGKVDAEALEVIEADSEIYRWLPRYVTWEAQLEAAFRELEQVVKLILWTAEISPAALGLDGTSAPESGKALRLRFISTEHKVNRKKLYRGPAYRRLIRTALELQAVRLGKEAPAGDVEIAWKDGLPQIYTEAVTDESTRVNAGLTSKKSAIMRLDGVDEEGAEEELERMAAEGAAQRAANPDPFGLGLENAQNGGSANQEGLGGQQPGQGGEEPPAAGALPVKPRGQ